MLKVYFSYLFPSHRAQASPQTPSILRDLGRQSAGTDISWTEKGALGYRKDHREMLTVIHGVGGVHPWPLCL